MGQHQTGTHPEVKGTLGSRWLALEGASGESLVEGKVRPGGGGRRLGHAGRGAWLRWTLSPAPHPGWRNTTQAVRVWGKRGLLGSQTGMATGKAGQGRAQMVPVEEAVGTAASLLPWPPAALSG